VPTPLVVTISHQLGRDEAKRRLDRGLDHVRAHLAPFVSAFDYVWSDYRLDWGVSAMRQHITGRTSVEDELVRIEIDLPLLLRMLSGQISDIVGREGAALLEKPNGG
jgi:hypothetical protein